MKINKYLLIAAVALIAFTSCSDDEKGPGNPILEPLTTFTSAYFADSLAFSVKVSDDNVALSTLKAQLYYGDEMVSETVIRTKTNGEYSGKIFVPFYANIPDADATLKLILQNINFTINEQSYTLPVSRADYPGLTLVMEDGTEKTMHRVSRNSYEITDDFDATIKAHILAPAYGLDGNDVTFGMSNGTITQGTTSAITFSEAQAGNYTIRFNTLTYDAGPFVVVKVNNHDLLTIDDNTSAAVFTIVQGEEMSFEGIANIDNWWMDPSFFERDENVYKFRAIDGYYKITANFALEYFRIEATDSDGTPLTLRDNGTGAVWIIGTDIGFPNLSNEVGWTTEKGICMAPIGSNKYQVELLAANKSTTPGEGTINSTGINFKFFHQRDWGGEFGNSTVLTTTGTLITVGESDGNLSLTDETPLEVGATYVFTLDVTSSTSAVLTVDKK